MLNFLFAEKVMRIKNLDVPVPLKTKCKIVFNCLNSLKLIQMPHLFEIVSNDRGKVGHGNKKGKTVNCNVYRHQQEWH
jgi:hypothetical protein